MKRDNMLRELIIRKKIQESIDYIQNQQNQNFLFGMIIPYSTSQEKLNILATELAKRFEICPNDIIDDINKYVTMDTICSDDIIDDTNKYRIINQNKRIIQYKIHRKFLNKLYDIQKNKDKKVDITR